MRATNLNWQNERFIFISEAKSFQRKKRKEGYKTKSEKHAGISHPYTLIFWTDK